MAAAVAIVQAQFTARRFDNGMEVCTFLSGYGVHDLYPRLLLGTQLAP